LGDVLVDQVKRLEDVNQQNFSVDVKFIVDNILEFLSQNSDVVCIIESILLHNLYALESWGVVGFRLLNVLSWSLIILLGSSTRLIKILSLFNQMLVLILIISKFVHGFITYLFEFLLVLEIDPFLDALPFILCFHGVSLVIVLGLLVFSESLGHWLVLGLLILVDLVFGLLVLSCSVLFSWDIVLWSVS